MKTKLDKSIFKFVEHELYNYQDTKEDLKDLEKSIAEEAMGNIEYDNFSSTESYPGGSTTESAAIDIIQNKVAKRMADTIKNIEKALGKLDEEKLELFFKKYKQTKPWQTIIVEMNISQATYFRWRKKIVIQVAKEMGLTQ